MKKIIFIVLAIISASLASCSNFNSSSKDAFWLSADMDTTTYYSAKINDTTYYIKFDKISSSKAEGHFLCVKDNTFANKEKFTVEKQRKYYILNTRSETYKLKLDLSVDGNTIVGKWAFVDKVLLIFNRTKWSDKTIFKKYQKPEFKSFTERYKTKIFDKIIIKKDIVYGHAKGFWDSYPEDNENYMEILLNGFLSTLAPKNLALRMDIYMPDSDSISNRPLILFIHGGGFYIGDKGSTPMVEWCKYFAQMGYVTVSMNYRLGYMPIGSSVERAGYRALQDAHAAMRFLVQNAGVYKINPDYLFAGGSSAGGVTSLNLAFMRNKNRPKSTKSSLLQDDQGNIESSTNTISQNFQLKAIINMWGAVNDLSILSNSKTSVISFHGDADKVVPIDYDYPFQDMKSGFNSLILTKMYGSLPIHIRLKELGIREELHIFENKGHSPHVDDNNNLNSTFYFISEKMKDFLYQELCPDTYKIKTVPLIPYKLAMPIYKTGCTNFVKIFWKIEGGLILSAKDNQVKVVWFTDTPKHILKLSLLTDSGSGYYDEYEF